MSGELTTQQTLPPPVWCCQSPEDIAWAAFADEFVAYHRPSGKTHFLNESSRQLICEILSERRTLAEVVDAFDAISGVVERDDYTEQMKATLDHFENLGLIERV